MGGTPHELREPLGQHGPRHAHLTRQLVQRPRVRGPLVQLGQRVPHGGVAQPGQPSGGLWRQRVQVAPHDLDEQQLRHARQHGVTARAARYFDSASASLTRLSSVPSAVAARGTRSTRGKTGTG